MVLAATVTITHHAAATAATSLHMYHEGEVVQTPLRSFADDGALDGVVVIAPQQGLVELFPADHQGLGELRPVASEALAQGWRVAVLVRAERMGEAHAALRGTPAHLQAWWPDGEQVRFGGPELP